MKPRARIAASLVALLFLSLPLAAREREPNSVYAARRAALTTKLSAPVILFGFTGDENSSPSYVFNQEENFYYLTGHNEEGAAILLLPPQAAGKGWKGPREILFLPERDPEQERWHGPRMAPEDPGIAAKTGFDAVEAITALKAPPGRIALQLHRDLHAHAARGRYRLPARPRLVGVARPGRARPAGATWRRRIGAMRQIKSPSEIALLTKAIDLSIDAHFVAMRTMRPGLYEYQVAARMVETHGWGGCEGEAYAPIVGTGFDSTVLHFNELSRQILDGDIVLHGRRLPVRRLRRRRDAHHPGQRPLHAAPERNLRNRARRAECRARGAQARHDARPQHAE